jgi:hypothetical protein
MEMMRALRQLADDKGLTIVAVVHQPSFTLLSLFDNIVLLCKGGRMAYAGPVKLMQRYFEELGYAFKQGENAVDVCLDAISGLIESSQPEVTAAALPGLWQKRASHVQQHDELVAAAGSQDAELPIAQLLPEHSGTKTQAAYWATMCFFFPPLCFVPFHYPPHRNQSAQYGGFFGALLALCVFSIVMFVLSAAGKVGLIIGEDTAALTLFVFYLYAFSSLNLAVASITLLGLAVAVWRRMCVSLPAHFVMSCALGPVLLPFYFLFREKLRYAAVLGLGVWLITFGASMGTAAVLIPAFFGAGYQASGFLPQWALVAQIFLVVFPCAGFCLISISAR